MVQRMCKLLRKIIEETTCAFVQNKSFGSKNKFDDKY